jgi:hypothetical protein
MHKIFGALLAFVAVVALVTAEEFSGSVTKFADGKLTIKKFNREEKKLGEPVTLSVAADCKFLKAKFNKEEMKIETDGELEGGKEAFAKRVKEAAAKKPDDPEKQKKFAFGGVFAQIITEGEGDSAKVTEIRVFPAFGKKKKDAE